MDLGVDEHAYGAINELIQACWKKVADERPDFEQIAKSLAGIHKQVGAATKAAAKKVKSPAQLVRGTEQTGGAENPPPPVPSEATAVSRRSAPGPAQIDNP